MQCGMCGEQNPDNVIKCIHCGENLQGPPAQPPVKVPNYLVPAILVTALCCMPLGVIGIVNAAQVNSKLAAGDYEGAKKASANARMFALIGAIVGFVVTAIYIGLLVAGVIKP